MPNPDKAPLTDTVVATPDPPSKGVHNPIHDAQGAEAAGYTGALVAGVRTYGWAARTVTRVLGDKWLSNGWIDYRLKRPLFAGEVVSISVIPDDQIWQVICTAGEDQRLVLDGTAGLGDAPWLAELSPPKPAPAAETQPPLPGYTLATVPLNSPLVPLGAWVTNATAHALVSEDLRIQDSHYDSQPTPIHPYFLAGRIAPLTRHNFTYGPTIHVRSQIQHRREALSERELVVGAQIVDAYDRNDHWYQVLDGIVTDQQGEVARIRHHTIFRPRGT